MDIKNIATNYLNNSIYAGVQNSKLEK